MGLGKAMPDDIRALLDACDGWVALADALVRRRGDLLVEAKRLHMRSAVAGMLKLPRIPDAGPARAELPGAYPNNDTVRTGATDAPVTPVAEREADSAGTIIRQPGTYPVTETARDAPPYEYQNPPMATGASGDHRETIAYDVTGRRLVNGRPVAQDPAPTAENPSIEIQFPQPGTVGAPMAQEPVDPLDILPMLDARRRGNSS